ncbi:squalene-associated FAD-dependent desaturase [Crenobacter luteus]|uniref:hydroxysqualene dehydroxylase HpnE n=1 Tax=Crenobacter luteus TaxID=1452487 RepID=UPI001046C2E2|nr:hydroxysqualene dehydroxylase HpnE [Crenobacter luteus]TCP10686.1 squalene-associated FAD-dependent desaturase [Crenobacter luteus]
MSRPRVAVIGAGWAGLAAAVELAPLAELTVFEAGRVAGGRARAVDADGVALDNGQHILIGAYRECLRLMRAVGIDPDAVLLRLPLQWRQADGVAMRCPGLPAPWHLAAGLAFARGWRWRDKLALALALSSLKKDNWRVDDALTVAEWLAALGQPARLIDTFWRPLVLSGMNTPLARASMAACAAMLRDSLGASRADGELLLPRTDLSRLFPTPALRWLAERGATLRLGRRVGRLDARAGGVTVDGEAFDAAVLAVAPYHAVKLTVPLPWHDEVKRWRFEPIYTVYLRFARAPRLPSPITGLARGTAHWLFDKGALTGDAGWLAAVVSAAGELAEAAHGEVVARVLADLRGVDPTLGQPLQARVIAEKRATFAAEPGRCRPDVRLAIQYAYLAGDWMHPEYPATLEGAVQSGVTAARALIDDLGLSA